MGISDNRIGNKIASQFDTSKSTGVKLQAGTYLGVVKNVNDPDRIGRLQVWIPDLGGPEEDDAGWYIVRYASPFMGSTDTRGEPGKKATDETFKNNGATYGMWMVPPDIGNQVLCTFINGDTNRGFWFACVMNRVGHYSLPSNSGGIAGEDFDLAKIQSPTLRATVTAAKQKGKVYLPLSEFNPYKKGAEDPQSRKKVVHEFMAAQYLEQGLHSDPIRGARLASAQRDMPSGVFGISTPGKPLRSGNANPNNVAAGKTVFEREGGHAFVMDDGDFQGNGSHMKFRSAGGNQILMDDDTGSIYMINASGSSWVEMAQSGQIFVYSGGGITMRTRGDFNIHSDKTIRMFAQQNIELRSDGNFTVEGKGKIGITGGQELNLFGDKRVVVLSEKGDVNIQSEGSVTAKAKKNIIMDADAKLALNTLEAPRAPKAPKGLSLYDKHPDTVLGPQGFWIVSPTDKVTSTVPIMPTHEPWDRNGIDVNSKNFVPAANQPAPTFYKGGSQPNPDQPPVDSTASFQLQVGGAAEATGLSTDFLNRNPGIKNAIERANFPAKFTPKAGSFTSQTAPNATADIGNISKQELSSLYTGIAMRSSFGDGAPRGSDYGMRNENKDIGRYAFNQQQLEDAGFLKGGTSSLYPKNGALDRRDTWNDPEGIDGFLRNPGAQEQAMQDLTKRNHEALLTAGVISANDPPAHVAGMLAVAHKLGTAEAVNWARTGATATNNKVSGSEYYNIGRASINSNFAGLYGKG